MLLFSLGALSLLSAVHASSVPATVDTRDPAHRLKCRATADSQGLLIKAYSNTQAVSLECQTNGTRVVDSQIWAKTSDSCYIPSYYIRLPGNDTSIASCNSLRNGPPSCTVVNNAGVAIIERYEGFINRPRADISGMPTIGYGHRCESLMCDEVPVEFPMSRLQALGLLRFDLGLYAQCLSEAIGRSVVLNENQWAALTSWAYDVGCEMAWNSQLVRRLNEGEAPAGVAASELPRWIRLHGKTTYDLQYRRNDEVALFNSPSSRQAHPVCGF